MIEYYIWFVCFLLLYISIFWISVMYLEKPLKTEKLKEFPFVSIIIPVWNEEKSVGKTIDELLKLDYPKEKYEVLLVDDESTDKSVEIIKSYKDKRIKLFLNKHRGIGKASAVNKGLENAKGEIIGGMDADSYVDKDALKLMLPYFNHLNVGAVITNTNVLEPKTFFEKMQRFEYIITNFVRRLMSFIGTLQITPGTLSLYKKDIIKKLGCFDENNLTEDYEIALRLIKNGYKVVMEPNAQSYTYVPNNFKSFWSQRTRWYRGFLTNNLAYKRFFLNKKYGLVGIFQTPVNFLTVFIILSSLVLMLYQGSRVLYNEILRLVFLKWDIFSGFEIPTLKEFILTLNFKLVFPVFGSLLFGLYFYYKAHRYVKEKIKYPMITFIYLFIYPFLLSLQWLFALVGEVFRIKRRW